MSNRWRTLMLSTVLVCASAGCVARQPPWRLHGRGPCADHEDRVERDRAKIAELEPTGARPDLLVWTRDDLHEAERDLNFCKSQSKGESK